MLKILKYMSLILLFILFCQVQTLANGPKKYKIVMLGNSLTHGGDWSTLLNRDDVAERGVVSDVIDGFRSRLPYVLRLKPELICVEGGINDIYNGHSAEEVFEDYKKLLNEIESNNIKIIVQSTLFVNPRWHNAIEKNLVVEQLDNYLKDYCSKNNIPFLDLNPYLTENKILKDELTKDGLHVNQAGYTIWSEQLHDLLLKLGY